METLRGYNAERDFRETHDRVTFRERSLLGIRTHNGRYGGGCTRAMASNETTTKCVDACDDDGESKLEYGSQEHEQRDLSLENIKYRVQKRKNENVKIFLV